MVDLLSIVGLIAAVASAIGFLPQVIRTFKTKKAEDVSLYMILVFIVSAVSWITYGYWKNDFFIISTNLAILLCTIMLFVMKLKYKR